MDDTDKIETYLLEDDGSIPNNPDLPVLVYPNALPSVDYLEQACRRRLTDHDWSGIWVDGVFNYHHYHSTAHEFLGIVGGGATLALGGPEGIEVEVERGDALVLPAGTGHCNLGQHGGFSVVGAYPDGQTWDLRRGDPDDRPEVLDNIQRVPLPSADPLFGSDGPLIERWS